MYMIATLCSSYVGAQAVFRFDIPPASEDVPVFLDNVQCLGTELRLEDCVSDTETGVCSHFFQDVGATCQP